MGVKEDAEAILGRPLVAGAMSMVIADLNARLRVKEMEEEYLAIPESLIPLPSYFIEAISADIDGNVLEYTPISLLRPGCFSLVGNDLHLAQGGKLLRVRFRSRILGEDDTERFARVQATYPGLFLYGLLSHHASLVRDDAGRSAWEARFEGMLSEANARDIRSRQSETPTRPVPRYCA